jgi:hypothetical protein
MLSDVGITFLVISGPVVCLVLALRVSARYARRVGRSTHQYTAVSIAGWLLGTIGVAAGVFVVLDRLLTQGLIRDGWYLPVVIYLAMLVGSFVGASVGHIWLRMATRRDPDYDDGPSARPPDPK